MKPAGRERLLMDSRWRFHLGHAADPGADFGFGERIHDFCKTGEAHGILRKDFDDSAWRLLDLPHDWAVELPFESIRRDDATNFHGYKPLGRGRPATSVGWYRKTFTIPEEDQGKCVRVEFDGVFRDCMVWVNGCYMGRHWSGYSSFHYDLSDYILFGKENWIVVRVDASLCEGWFYEGAGIYRHVWLTKTAPLHVAHWGHQVAAEPDPASLREGRDRADFAVVRVKTSVANQSDAAVAARILTTIRDAAGRKVASAESRVRTWKPWQEIEVEQELKIPKARLWSIETPYLYKAHTAVRVPAGAVDTVETCFGVRSVRFDPDAGFFLNERPVKLKGVCCHQDHAGVGSALPDAIQAFRIRRLKEMGCNAYRTSHNPPTPELLDECDRQGMLVMDEQRTAGSHPDALCQLDRMIRRDRNHPSVVIWSLGNEEHGIQGEAMGRRILATMKRLARKLDPTRLVTVAMNNGGAGEGFVHVVDVQGWNYVRLGQIDEWHTAHPAMPIVGSEEASTLCTRGVYARNPHMGHVVAYDHETPSWGKTAEEWWTFACERPWYAGGFIWTGFDYRGEPTPYSWPCINSHFGVLDTCGFPKDNFYYYQAWWTGQPVLHLLPHWNWAGREGQEIDVRCLSNCEEAELWLNGRSLGRKAIPRNSHARWAVPYQPGCLLAKGYRDGYTICTAKVETAGPAARIRLTPDRNILRANGEDVAMVEVAILDAKGRLVPTADTLVSFAVKGRARIIGVGNGNPSSHEPDKASRRQVFQGLCQVIVQTDKQAGPVRLTASAPQLSSGRLRLESVRTEPRPFVP